MIAVVAYEVILKNSLKTSNIFGAFGRNVQFGNILFYLKAHQDFSKSFYCICRYEFGVIVIEV
jgi:hypothetical protein